MEFDWWNTIQARKKYAHMFFLKFFFYLFFLFLKLHLFQTSRGQVTRFLPQIYKIMKFTPFWVTYPKLVKKVNVLRGGDLDLINYWLYCSIWKKWGDYFLHRFSPFTYRIFKRLSLVNPLSGNDCNLLNDKSLWKDEKNEVIYKKIDAQGPMGDAFNPLYFDKLVSRHFLRLRKRRICVTIKNSIRYLVIISFILITLMFDYGLI